MYNVSDPELEISTAAKTANQGQNYMLNNHHIRCYQQYILLFYDRL